MSDKCSICNKRIKNQQHPKELRNIGRFGNRAYSYACSARCLLEFVKIMLDVEHIRYDFSIEEKYEQDFIVEEKL
jgi:hypothetical protein